MLKSTITQKGQITIPARIRAKLHLQPGDIVSFAQKNEHIIIIKEKNDIKASFGIIKAKLPVSLQDMQHAIEKGVTDD